MVDEKKLKEKIMEFVKKEGAELRYSFLVYHEEDKLKFFALVNKGELHTIVGMLERAKKQLLERIEEM